MNKEQINKIINDRLDYFIRGCDNGFITQRALDDMRYAISKVQEDINNAFVECPQSINNEKLDELAKKKYPLEDGIEASHWNAHQCELRDAFKAGISVAMQFRNITG